MEIVTSPVQTNKFPSAFFPDTEFFCRALDYFRRVYCDGTPFHLMAADQRAIVLRLSQQFKLGIDVCEGEDQWGHGSDTNGMDCTAIGTICDLKSERLLCERHFREGER